MESARVFPCVVCTSKHLISRVEKKKMMMKYIDEIIDLTQDMSNFECLKNASVTHHYLTTRLQYKTLKYLRAIYSILYKILTKLSKQPSSVISYIEGPLKNTERSMIFRLLTRTIVEHSYSLGTYFLEIDADSCIWRTSCDETITLLNRIRKFLWKYCLTYHRKKCKDCK